ncbi:MAG: hypothetical protein R3190_12490, partial [Thermoanaerobaculia bacterium]|nr:hypothetical protein [Thermoanaerobaculia bacterium]
MRSEGEKAWDAPLFAALVAGVYVTVFFVVHNLTMLTGISMLLLLGAFTIPMLVLVAAVQLAMRRVAAAATVRAVSIVLCT